jgi:hypothetical protein
LNTHPTMKSSENKPSIFPLTRTSGAPPYVQRSIHGAALQRTPNLSKQFHRIGTILARTTGHGGFGGC